MKENQNYLKTTVHEQEMEYKNRPFTPTIENQNTKGFNLSQSKFSLNNLLRAPNHQSFATTKNSA